MQNFKINKIMLKVLWLCFFVNTVYMYAGYLFALTHDTAPKLTIFIIESKLSRTRTLQTCRLIQLTFKYK